MKWQANPLSRLIQKIAKWHYFGTIFSSMYTSPCSHSFGMHDLHLAGCLSRGDRPLEDSWMSEKPKTSYRLSALIAIPTKIVTYIS